MVSHHYPHAPNAAFSALSTTEDFGESLRRIREARNISQSAFAKEIGVSIATISMWENGRRHPTVQHLMAICDIFDTPMVTLGENSFELARLLAESRENIARFLGTSANKVRIMIEI